MFLSTSPAEHAQVAMSTKHVTRFSFQPVKFFSKILKFLR